MKTYCFLDRSEFAESEFELWSDGYVDAYVNDGTCLLSLDHDGEHVFTPHDKFCVVCDVDGYRVELLAQPDDLQVKEFPG